MKKTIITTLFLILGFVGFLIYDWHKKTTIQKDDKRVTLYSWTDQKGVKHFTDTQPPDDAWDVDVQKGYQYGDQPMVMKIKNAIMDAYQWTKEKFFKKKEKQSLIFFFFTKQVNIQ